MGPKPPICSLTAKPVQSLYDNGMKLEQRHKVGTGIIFAGLENAAEIRHLAENPDWFTFIPGVHTPEE